MFEFFIRKDVYKAVVIGSSVFSKEVSMLDLLWCSGLHALIIILFIIQQHLGNNESSGLPNPLSNYSSSHPHGGILGKTEVRKIE